MEAGSQKKCHSTSKCPLLWTDRKNIYSGSSEYWDMRATSFNPSNSRRDNDK